MRAYIENGGGDDVDDDHRHIFLSRILRVQ
jgi:hypothetical protein